VSEEVKKRTREWEGGLKYFQSCFCGREGAEAVSKGLFIQWSILLDFSLGTKHRLCDMVMLSMISTRIHTHSRSLYL
jgi:hypothetical protein